MSTATKADVTLPSWKLPNNTNELLAQEEDQDRLRKIHALWKTAPSEAFQGFLSLAEKGSIYSMLQVAHAFLTGNGTDIDNTKAEDWLLRAHSLGSEEAMFTLADEYRRQMRYGDAEALLEKALQGERSPALYQMGLIYIGTSRPKEAREVLVKAKDLGHQWASATLLRQNIRGAFGLRSVFSGVTSIAPFILGVKKILDEKDADNRKKLWFKRGFWQPDISSKIWANEKDKDSLRKSYALWKTDAAQAFKDFQKFSEEGSVWSMFQVGRALLNSQGTKFDPLQAELWFRRADAAGYEIATFALAWELKRQKRYSDAETVLSPTVERNVPSAVFLLGLIYIDTDRRREAEKMLRRATNLGHQVARSELKDRYLSGYFGFPAMAHGIPLALSDWRHRKKKADKKSAVENNLEIDPEVD